MRLRLPNPILCLLLLPVILCLGPAWLQEVRLFQVSNTAGWSDVFSSPLKVHEKYAGEGGGAKWNAQFYSGSGGDGYYLDVAYRDKDFHWDTCFDCGSIMLKIDKSGSTPRFLVYQPIFDGNTNHYFFESPELLHAGIWLVDAGPEGYSAHGLVTHSAALILRNPLSLISGGCR